MTTAEQRELNGIRTGNLHGVNPYRGLAPVVQGLDLEQTLAAAGMNWKAVTLPVDVQGRHSHKRAEGFQAIVRSDDGHIIDITRDSFKVHQNRDTVGLFHEMAEAGNLTLTHAGILDHGAEIFAVAKGVGEFSMKAPEHGKPFNDHAGKPLNGEDKTELHFILRSGHRPGTPTTCMAVATRLWCFNGVRFTEQAQASFRLVHRSEFKGWARDRFKEVVELATREFATYEVKAKAMVRAQMPQVDAEKYVVGLLQPDLLAKVCEATKAQTMAPAVDQGVSGRMVLNAILESDASRDLLDVRKEYNRGVRLVVENLDKHPGALPGTVWNAFNAMTYYVDHTRGRTADSGLRSALFGDGDKLKKQALDNALEYAAHKAVWA